MSRRLFVLPFGMVVLMGLSGLAPCYASEPAEDERREGASRPLETVTDKPERPADSEPRSSKTDTPQDDLRDFGITGTPVLEPPPAATPPPDTLEPPPERILWNKTPIRITLPVGQERLVHFPADVRVGLPSPPPPGLRTQSIDGTVYWYAQEPFPTTRVQVQELATGQMVLLDLLAQPGADTTPIQILRSRSADPAVMELGTQNQTASAAAQATANFVQLTRYAAQQLYAPQRLVRELPGIYPVPVNTDPVTLVRGGHVEARPLIAWRGGEDYITAVRLQNLTGQAVILDPRDLRGQWAAATFQQARLLPRGDEADTTCVYLISARPFTEALRGLY